MHLIDVLSDWENILLLFPEQKPPEKAFKFAFSEFLRSKAHNPLVVCT